MYTKILKKIMWVNFMWLYRFWLLCDLFIPFIMTVVGRMTSKHCPKNINSLTWKFAHEYCGKLWWKIGWIMIILSALIYIPLYQSDNNVIGIAGVVLITIQCIILIVSIYPTEKALKEHFNTKKEMKLHVKSSLFV